MTAFIFDMDGTLVDNMDVHIQIWLRLLAEQGVRLTKDEFYHQSAGKTNIEILCEYLGMDAGEAAVFADRKEAIYREEYGDSLKAVDGVYDFLAGARRLNIPLAVATSAPPANVDFILKNLQLESYFGAVVNGAQVQNGKPHPEMFLTAARLLGVRPADCLVFEDAPMGIEAAHRAGMKTVVITPTLGPGDLPGVEPYLRSASDFTGLDPADLARSPA
jgi:beta-phosphoglucomutase